MILDKQEIERWRKVVAEHGLNSVQNIRGETIMNFIETISDLEADNNRLEGAIKKYIDDVKKAFALVALEHPKYIHFVNEFIEKIDALEKQ